MTSKNERAKEFIVHVEGELRSVLLIRYTEFFFPFHLFLITRKSDMYNLLNDGKRDNEQNCAIILLSAYVVKPSKDAYLITDKK